MALLADFVVATPEDALQYELVHEGNSVPPDRFERREYKNFTPLAMELLWAVLRGDKEAKKLRRLAHMPHRRWRNLVGTVSRRFCEVAFGSGRKCCNQRRSCMDGRQCRRTGKGGGA